MMNKTPKRRDTAEATEYRSRADDEAELAEYCRRVEVYPDMPDRLKNWHYWQIGWLKGVLELNEDYPPN